MKRLFLFQNIIFLCIVPFLLFSNCKTSYKSIRFDQNNNYVIEDFDHYKNKWYINSIPENSGNIFIKEDNGNNSGSVNFNFKEILFDHLIENSITVFMKKDLNLCDYNGLEIKMRSGDLTNVQILLYEKNQFNPYLCGYEIWYYSLKISNNWQIYRVPFDSMKPEEYWEQNFIGDDVLQLTNIDCVGIRIKFKQNMKHRTGNLLFDDIFLYKDQKTITLKQ